jgi:hypothetical protein
VQGRWERLAPLAGPLFTVLFAIAFFVSGETPDVDASGEKVISHYDDEGKYYVALIALLISAAAFLFFAGALRNALATSVRAADWLPTVVFGGAIVYTVGLAMFGNSTIALLDAADLGEPQVAQALNISDNDNFFPAVTGIAVVLLAAAWSTLASRPRPIPAWLGWVALVLGIVAFAGPLGFISFLAFPIWVLIVGILLYRRGTAPHTEPAVP